MSKPLNFNNLKKKYLTVTLPDEEHTVVMVACPTRGLIKRFNILLELIEEVKNDGKTEDGVDVTDELYSAVAVFLSRNKMGVTITKEKLDEIFDYEDIVIFLNAYQEFIAEVTSSKN